MLKHGREKFNSIRKRAYESLEEISSLLDESNPNIPQAVQSLNETLSSLETLQHHATYEEEYRRCNVPTCFPERCKLIRETLQHFILILGMESDLQQVGIKKRMISRFVLMIAVLSTHVGRITLDKAEEGLDRLAKHCDNEVLAFDMPWSPLGVDFEGELGGEIDGLVDKWGKLNLAFDGCECLQCLRRGPKPDLELDIEEDEDGNLLIERLEWPIVDYTPGKDRVYPHER